MLELCVITQQRQEKDGCAPGGHMLSSSTSASSSAITAAVLTAHIPVHKHSRAVRQTRQLSTVLTDIQQLQAVTNC